MTPSLRAAAAACLLASCGAETLMKYVLVPGFDSDDAPMFSRWGVPLHWDSTLNETELQTKARDFATTYHLRQTHACGNDVPVRLMYCTSKRSCTSNNNNNDDDELPAITGPCY